MKVHQFAYTFPTNHLQEPASKRTSVPPIKSLQSVDEVVSSGDNNPAVTVTAPTNTPSIQPVAAKTSEKPRAPLPPVTAGVTSPTPPTTALPAAVVATPGKQKAKAPQPPVVKQTPVKVCQTSAVDRFLTMEFR